MMMPLKNLLSRIPESISEELVEVLAQSDAVRIERIVSMGHSSPQGFWYDQSQDEFVLVLEGEACLLMEGEKDPIEMTAGDCLNIPAHCRHRVESTSDSGPTVWLAVFY